MAVVIPAGRHPGTAEMLMAGGTLPRLWAATWSSPPRAAQPALLDGADPTKVLDGGQLAELTGQAAAGLRELGVGAGDRVLWSCSAGLDAIVALLGAMRAGAVVVPVNPSSTAAELAHLVGDAQPAVAVVDGDDHGEWVGAAAPGIAIGRPAQLLADGRNFGAAGGDLDRSRPDDDALIVYTSGTTGKPKGAVHTHRSLLAGVQSVRAAWGWQPDDRLILALPLFHVHGLCAGLFGTLTAGASAVVFDRFREESVLAAAPSCTMFFGVPTMYHRLAGTGRAGELRGLRLCVSGSAPLPAELWHRLAREGLPVLERYGMSETLLTLSNPLEGERRPGTVGTPLPGIEAAIDQPDERGVGELLVRGPSLCRGFWGRRGATEAMADNGWFGTGDLASVDSDGYVAIRGRRTELIITGGHNVYPAEVEAVLAGHPSVAEVAVVGCPSPEWGESVVAFVVGADGAPDLDALEALATEQLAAYKRPRRFEVTDALPRNAMGKVLRGQLGGT
jgi:malonyl-CoA/methylmalonyl-CoA synthetase